MGLTPQKQNALRRVCVPQFLLYSCSGWFRKELAMSNHGLIRVTDLRREVLADAAKSHTLDACPKCGGEVRTTWTCSLGCIVSQTVGDQGRGKWEYLCESCNIIWTLEAFNGVHERWAFNSYFHSIRLHGRWNCQCRARVLTRGTSFFNDSWIECHNLCPGHAMLGEPCGARQGQLPTVLPAARICA
jgi:hypothetical protein